MPAKSLRVNLAPKDEFEESLIGRILKWALTAGKSIVILTEFVVILAFLSRFKLDMDLNDLNEQIIQKQAVIVSYAEVEQQMRDLLAHTTVVKTTMSNTIGVQQSMNNLMAKLPAEVLLDSLTVNKDSVTMKGTSSTEMGLANLIAQFRNDNSYNTVTVGEVSFNQRKGVVEFSLTAENKVAKKEAPKPVTSTTNNEI